MEIYPAREAPIPGVTSAALAALIIGQEVEVMSPEQIYSYVAKRNFDVLLTIGAGDIDRLIPHLKNILQ
jgi:UDP-N-acetylmuramate--alanine ligase